MSGAAQSRTACHTSSRRRPRKRLRKREMTFCWKSLPGHWHSPLTLSDAKEKLRMLSKSTLVVFMGWSVWVFERRLAAIPFLSPKAEKFRVEILLKNFSFVL
jgi:hypothetical protein